MGRGPDDRGAGLAAGCCRHPALGGEVGSEVDDRQARSTGGDREGEGAELVPAPRAEADEDRVRGWRVAGCLECHRQAPQDRVAGGVLTRDVDPSGFPSVADCPEGRHHDPIDDDLETGRTEGLVECHVERGAIHRRRCLHHPVDEVGSEIRRDGFATGGPASGRWRIGEQAIEVAHAKGPNPAGGLLRGPTRVDEVPHGPQPIDGLGVVQAIAAGAPCRRHDPIAALPGAEERNADAAADGRLFDGVHASYILRHRTNT